MKKFFALLLTAVMLMSVMSFASAEGFSGEIKIWVAENVVDFTTQQVEAFKAAHPEYAGMTVLVQPVGEGDAASNMITDVEGGADIFGFAPDQLARLVAAGALEEINPDYIDQVKADNDAGSIVAATLGGKIYAYPMTSDNGYFMYYDKSVITNPDSLEQIIADAEAAGKRIYMDIRSGWYNVAFFFGAGCMITYETDDEGNYLSCNVDYASENGVKALKSMIKLAKSPSFANGSSAGQASDYAVLVSGTWDVDSVKQALGDNYAATKLPTVDGYQLGSFSGNKLLGIKPQIDEAKLEACDALALYLTSEEVQTARYKAVGWGPSNLNSKKDEAVQQDVALSALMAQSAFSVFQGQYPGDYWSRSEALGDSVIAHELDNADDAQLLDVLTKLQEDFISYAK